MLIVGNWKEGYAIDFYTLWSTFVGHDEYGHPQFDTKRSELGELLYRLKNKADQSAVPGIVAAIVGFLDGWKPMVDVLVPVPPSRPRQLQPVLILAQETSSRVAIPLSDCVRRTREAPQLKNVYDLDERSNLLKGLHTVDGASVSGKKVLLFDDLYRSGATMNSIASILYEMGGASEVFALTVTRTRSIR